MKRLLTLIFVGIMALALAKHGDFDLLSFSKIERACFVSSEASEDAIKSGNDFYYYVDKESMQEKKEGLKDVSAVVLYIQNSSLDEIQKYYKIQSYRGGDVEGMAVYYGYSPLYKDYRMVDGKKINVQIAVYEDEFVVGFPSIVTGF